MYAHTYLYVHHHWKVQKTYKFVGLRLLLRMLGEKVGYLDDRRASIKYIVIQNSLNRLFVMLKRIELGAYNLGATSKTWKFGWYVPQSRRPHSPPTPIASCKTTTTTVEGNNLFLLRIPI